MSNTIDIKSLNGYALADEYARNQIAELRSLKFFLQHNLLDNSDFRNPVNQRGQTSYTGSGVTIDRWRIYSAATVSVTAAGLVVDASSVAANLQQNHESLPNGVLTFAAKVNGNIAVRVVNNNNGTVTTVDNSKAAFTGGYLQLGKGTSAYYVQVVNSVGYKNTVEWMALYEGEYTAETLPAYVPKGYAAELAECQRYFWRCDNTWLAEGCGYAFSAELFHASIVLPQMMRATPVMSSSTGDTTHYGIKINVNSGARRTPTAITFELKNNRIAMKLSGSFTNGELGVLRLENNYLDFSADL